MNQFLLSVFCLLTFTQAVAQTKTPYGNNPQAGRYVQVNDAKIYYEVYGQGKPVVLLHGGLFGYIDEFENLIPKLTEKHQVIAIATRGHGKSEIGTEPFSYELLADDAYQVIKSLTKDSVVVIGFSAGGNIGYTLTARHPELVKKFVGIGSSPERPKPSNPETQEKTTGESLEKEAPDFVRSRKQLMPDPSQWNGFIEKLSGMDTRPGFLTDDDVRRIKCPVLVVAGEKDPYVTPEKAVKLFRLLQRGQISLIPNCEHVVLYCNFPAVWEAISPFVNQPLNRN